MSNEVLTYIPNNVVELFEAFDDDYLADVLRVWDCDAQGWFDPFTTVFRFESDDLLVWNDAGMLRCRQGAVDTNSINCLAPDVLDIAAMTDFCLCWITDKAFSSLIGEKAQLQTMTNALLGYSA